MLLERTMVDVRPGEDVSPGAPSSRRRSSRPASARAGAPRRVHVPGEKRR